MLKKYQHDLITNKYTEVHYKDDFTYHAPHDFEVMISKNHPEGNNLAFANVHFQEGPIKESGVNGVMNEDLISMCICRLEHFQKSEFACRENAVAITKLEEALMWLRKRTMEREARGVEGTHIK